MSRGLQGMFARLMRRAGRHARDAAKAANSAGDAHTRGVGATIERALRDAGLMGGTPASRNADRASAERSTVADEPARDNAANDAQPHEHAPVGFTSGTFRSPHGQRDYKLFVPTGPATRDRALIVMLHGCTQDPDDFAAGTQMNAIAQREGFVVLYPAQVARANQAKCWNWFNPADQQRGAGEPALIAAMTRYVIATADIDPDRVYVTGLSAGGAMAALLGRAYPDLFAAIGVHSGLPPGAAHDVPSAFAAMRRGGAAIAPARDGVAVPTIVFHGDRDTTVHPDNGERIIAAGEGVTVTREADGAPGRRYQRRVYTSSDGGVRGEHWLVHGIGHAWSGGSVEGTYTDVLGPDASAEMVRFFKSHRRARG